jgi:hypothetical protein
LDKLRELTQKLKPYFTNPTFPWSLGVALGMIIFFTPHPEWHGDLHNFRNYVDQMHHPFYARWLFSLMSIPSEPVAYVILSLTSTLLFVFALRIFQGKPWMVFTSYAFAWTLIYGQIDALVVAGLAVAWWALKHDRPVLLGAGLILASVKPQMSLPLIIAFWWWSPSRLRSLIVPALIVILSFIQWGWWIPEWLDIQLYSDTNTLIQMPRNISLWPITGSWIFLIWPIILVIRLPRQQKMLALAAATAVTTPYFPLPSAVLFLTLPVPWWTWVIAQLPLLTSIVGIWIFNVVRILPPALLLWAVWPSIRNSSLATIEVN